MGRPRFSRALTLPLEPRHLAAQVDDFVALHGDLVLLFADQFNQLRRCQRLHFLLGIAGQMGGQIGR